MRRALSLLVVLAACGGAPPSPTVPASTGGDGPAPTSAAPVIARGAGDLDGVPGDETVELHADGTLIAGAMATTITVPAADEAFAAQRGVRVIALDRARGVRAVLVSLPTDEVEDPPSRVQLLVVDGGALRLVLDTVLGTYGATELRAPGDGTLRYVEDGWAACTRAGHPPTPVVREEIALGARADGTWGEVGRAPTAQTQDCGQLAG